MISYSKILPLLIIVAILSFSVRLTEVITGFSDLSASAYAKEASQEEKHADESEKKAGQEDNGNKNAEAKDDHEGEDKKPEEKEGDVEHVEGKEAEAPEWRDASDSNLDVASIKLEMFEDLSERRNHL